MKYLKLVIALLAACVLTMPAFSMPTDQGNGNQMINNGNPQMGPQMAPQGCQCQNQINGQPGNIGPQMGQPGNNGPQMGSQAGPQGCPCQNQPNGQPGNDGHPQVDPQGHKSMMGNSA